MGVAMFFPNLDHVSNSGPYDVFWGTPILGNLHICLRQLDDDCSMHNKYDCYPYDDPIISLLTHNQ